MNTLILKNITYGNAEKMRYKICYVVVQPGQTWASKRICHKVQGHCARSCLAYTADVLLDGVNKLRERL